jgi:RND family efflux transporter MFP subunit
MRTCTWLLLAVILISSCGKKEETGIKSPIRVATEVVQNCTDLSSHTYVGIVEESEATAVSFTGMGVVRRMMVSEGQAVSRGQLLAEMDDTQARSMLTAAEAAMAQANDALQRYSMLHDAGALPEVQWVEIQSKVAQAESQLAMARKNLSDCRLTSPVSGVVGHKYIGVGETALPSQAVVSIFNIGSVKVKVAIPEMEINAINSDTPSTINVDAVGQVFSGGRIEKSVQADALTHTYDIRINVANTGRQLLPGMVASVRFEASSSPSQESDVKIPVTAVQRRADGSLFVWTVGNDSVAHRTTIAIGQTTGNRVAITSGVQPGQRVITEGYQKLSEGTKVVF